MKFEHALLKNNSFLRACAMSLLMLIAALVSVFYSAIYANVSASTSNSVTDIILSNTRVYDVNVIFVYGALVVVLFSAFILLGPRLRHFPFVLKSVALLLFIRSIFVSLTHISPYPNQAVISETFLFSTNLSQMFFTGDDLFFSGHVGLTFMMALLLWDSPVLRYIYLAVSVLFAAVVLLGHLHYSIDVFAAYFITYSVFVIARNIFRTDYERTQQG